METYDPSVIEAKWRKLWQKWGLDKTDLQKANRPYYNLMMYPYPSAEGLHVGNVYAFTGADIRGRFKKMQGFQVFEPIGFDSGGIHSENYAIKMGVHPKIQVPKNVKHFKEQLHKIGCMYDWDHTVDAMDPSYYKWTQWLFVQLFKAGLAYKKKSSVTYCPACKTTLSDEQTEEKEGQRICERCKTPVVKKDLEQWFFKITQYAERLLQNTYKLDWSEKVLLAQRNWIGKSEGINIDYQVVGSQEKITCFTTTPVNFGATFIVVAPEYPKLAKLLKLASLSQKKTVEEYVKKAKLKSEMERIAEGKEKTGVFIGAYVLNHVTGKKIPVWVTDFVLAHVGTGAVQGCPGHDQRDFIFAKKYGLPIPRVVVGEDGDDSPIERIEQVVEKGMKGKMINSDFLNGMDFDEAIKKTIDYFVKKGWGKRQTIYKLRDWCISRQRYWGPPIPMIYCPKCKWQAVPEDQLPVLLPDIDDYLPGKAGGKSPLARLPEFVKTKCPKCGGEAQRETDVSDTFLDSSWYFLRYPNIGTEEYQSVIASEAKQSQEIATSSFDKLRTPRNDKTSPFNLQLTKKWLPVTQYTGGAEHSVLHLLYSRFVTMALHDLGYLDFEEPFPRFFAHGLIIKDGAKMSKSRGNVVNPDDYIAKFGTDALRMYLMFLGPFHMGGDFRDTGMIGMYKFLGRIYRFCQEKFQIQNSKFKINELLSKDEAYWINKTIKKVGEDIEKYHYNTAIAAIMEDINFLSTQTQVSLEAVKVLILVLSPFAPYLSEELWQEILRLPGASHRAMRAQDDKVDLKSLSTLSIHAQPWPTYDPKLIQKDSITIVVQVNGRVRDKINVGADFISARASAGKEEIIKLALNSPKIQSYLQGKKPGQTIFVPGKLVNFVV